MSTKAYAFLGSRSARKAVEAKGIFDVADDAGRDLTDDERARVQSLLDGAKVDRELEVKMAAIGHELGAPDLVPDSPMALATLSAGERFVKSEGYKSIRAARGESWSTGMIEVAPAPMQMKGTLLEGAGAPGSGSGGGLLPTPQVAPGIVATLFRPLVFEDLLLGGQATTSTIRYARQGTATSGAAGVAEAGNKPESTLGFDTADESVKKVATSITLSDEIIEDAPAVQAFINGQLGSFVRLEVERQLLRGTSGGNEIQGLLTSRSVPVYAGGTAAGGTTPASAAIQVLKAMNGMRGSAFLEPEWIAMDPSDWEKIRLVRDNSGQFMGGGPFQGQYGQGASLSTSGQLSGATDVLWGKPVYLSPLLGAGTALIGNSQAAQVWSRGGLRVEASNSHSTYFTSDLVAIRAERRVALTVYRSGGFVECRITHVANP